MEICPFKDYFEFCNGHLQKGSEDNTEIKQQRGADSINNASNIIGTNITVEIGSFVHKECRKRYTNPKYLKTIKKRKIDDGNSPVASLRSKSTPGFKYSTHCVLCGKIAVDSNGEKLNYVYRVSSFDCQNSFITCCESRGDDEWAKKVKSNISFAGDLPAKDVLYHHQCSTNFRIGKSIPRKFCSSYVNEVNKGGRPKNEEKFTAFQSVIDDFYENNDESITVSELIERMKTKVSEPYSERSMIRELNKIDEIFITQIGKEKNIVTTKTSASRALNNFHKKIQI